MSTFRRPRTGYASNPPSGAAAGGASWTTLTASGADNTLAGQSSVTWSDESGSELRATVDTTVSQTFNNLANHGGMLIWDTGKLVSDSPLVHLRWNISNYASTGADIYYCFGVVIAATTTPTFSTDKSMWWMTLSGPNSAVGTTVHANALANNANPGSNSDKTLAEKVAFSVDVMASAIAGSGFLTRNSSANIERYSSNVNTTGLTSSDKVLVFACAGHRFVDTPTETVGGKLDMIVSGGPTG